MANQESTEYQTGREKVAAAMKEASSFLDTQVAARKISEDIRGQILTAARHAAGRALDRTIPSFGEVKTKTGKPVSGSKISLPKDLLASSQAAQEVQRILQNAGAEVLVEPEEPATSAVAEADEEAEEEKPYDPAVSIERDFSTDEDEGWIYYDDEGEPIIESADTLSTMNFHRKSVQPGTMLSLGCGPTHCHYAAVTSERLTHITALDLGESNLATVKELLDASGPDAEEKAADREHIEDNHVESFDVIAAYWGRHGKWKDLKNGETMRSEIREKSMNPDGSYDLIQGDEHDLDAAVGDKKFDNILINYAIYAKDAAQLVKMFKGIRDHLAPGGRLTIVDLVGFDETNVTGDYAEDPEVLKRCPAVHDVSLKSLLPALKKAGFEVTHSEEKDLEEEGFEQEQGFKNVYVTAEVK